MLRFKNLGSGSSGNATLVQVANASGGSSHILVDCGLGVRILGTRLSQAGLLIEDLDAIFVTHEHGDHIGCARQLALRYQIPLWMSHGTQASVDVTGLDSLLKTARDGEAIEVGGLQVTPFTVPHDAREPLQLTCTDGMAKLGILTDLGHATAHVIQHLMNCSALLLESNHDSELLTHSPYPAFLKRRIGGSYGHLSNAAAAQIAKLVMNPGLRHLVAGHLSEQNNRPDLVRQCLSEALSCQASDILVADPATGTPWLQA